MKFKVWCASKRVCPLPPSLSSVLNFMVDLSCSAASQVKTFVAVLAVINNLNGWKSPYSFDAIKRLTKAIEKRRPKNKKRTLFFRSRSFFITSKRCPREANIG
jgi:hypothetical protein